MSYNPRADADGLYEKASDALGISPEGMHSLQSIPLRDPLLTTDMGNAERFSTLFFGG